MKIRMKKRVENKDAHYYITYIVKFGHFADFEFTKHELVVYCNFERGGTANSASYNSFRHFAQNQLAKMPEARLVTSPATLNRNSYFFC